MGTSKFNAVGYPVMEYHPIQGGRGGGGDKIILVASCYRSQDKLQPDWAAWLVSRHYLFLKGARSCYFR